MLLCHLCFVLKHMNGGTGGCGLPACTHTQILVIRDILTHTYSHTGDIKPVEINVTGFSRLWVYTSPLTLFPDICSITSYSHTHIHTHTQTERPL